MELEKEIKQKAFINEYQKLLVNILYTGSWANSLQAKFFKTYGLSPQQYNILRILRGQFPNPATVFLLTERMLDKMSNASRLVDKLVTKNLVERKECETNKRRVDITITEDGLALLKEIDQMLDVMEKKFHSLNKDEAKTLNILLDKLRG